MARARKNPVLDGVSGVIGGTLVVKTIKGGRLVLAAKPTFGDDRVFSDKQKAHQARFQAGTVYAKQAAKTEPIYAQLAEGTARTAYNVALADFMRPPQIFEIDLSACAGRAGTVIRAQVWDNVCVKRVQVVIVNAAEQVIEQGDAVQGEGLWWSYTATVDAPNEKITVSVHAWDLPGNEVVKRAEKG